MSPPLPPPLSPSSLTPLSPSPSSTPSSPRPVSSNDGLALPSDRLGRLVGKDVVDDEGTRSNGDNDRDGGEDETGAGEEAESESIVEEGKDGKCDSAAVVAPSLHDDAALTDHDREEGRENAKKEVEEQDEEGLLKSGYDVAIVGTGIVQSILASALSRAGLSVLHCDSEDLYGECDAALTLDQLEDWVNDLSERRKMRMMRHRRRRRHGLERGGSGSDTKEALEGGGDDVEDDDKETKDETILPLKGHGALSSARATTTTMLRRCRHERDGDGDGDGDEAARLRVGDEVVTRLGNGVVLSLPRPMAKTTLTNRDDGGSGDGDGNHREVERWSSLAVQMRGWAGVAYFGYDPGDASNSDSDGGTGLSGTEDCHSLPIIPSLSSWSSSLERYYEQRHGIISAREARHRTMMRSHARRFALDLSPALLHATGKAVDGLVLSGVSEYCEFKLARGLYLLAEEGGSGLGRGYMGGTDGKLDGAVMRKKAGKWADRKKSNKSNNGYGKQGGGGNGRNENKDESVSKKKTDSGGERVKKDIFPLLRLERVPCSKAEVFKSDLLGPLDKRRLMKFLQLASDYAVAEQFRLSSSLSMAAPQESGGGSDVVPAAVTGADADADTSSFPLPPPPSSSLSIEDVQSLNERELKIGRSLGRPQNKEVSTSEMDALRLHIESKTDFDAYLRDVHKLPDRLRTIVVHAMAMGPSASSSSSSSYTVGRGMSDLARHLTSLGRYGGSAFLLPMYGSGDLSQSFCRSSAVHGGTYLLRRAALGVKMTEPTAAADARVEGIVLERRSNDGGDGDGDGVDTSAASAGGGKVVRARNVVVPSGALTTTRHTGARRCGKHGRGCRRGRVHRRISILLGPLIMDGADGDVEQRYVIVVPPRTAGIGNDFAIQGLVVDASVGVAPSDGGYTVLHLTTISRRAELESSGGGGGGGGGGSNGSESEEDEDEEEKRPGEALDRAGRALVERSGTRAEELWSAAFSFDLDDDGVDDADGGVGVNPPPSYPRGMHVFCRPPPSVSVEPAFEEAERLFREICDAAAGSSSGGDGGERTKFLARSRALDEEIRRRLGGAAAGGGPEGGVGAIVEDYDDEEGMALSSAAAMIGGGPVP